MGKVLWTTPDALLGVLMGEIRRARGVKAADLMAAYGVSQSHVSRMETGDASMRFQHVWEFCLLLDIQPADLFTELLEWIDRVQTEGVIVRSLPLEGHQPMSGEEVRRVYLARALPENLSRKSGGEHEPE